MPGRKVLDIHGHIFPVVEPEHRIELVVGPVAAQVAVLPAEGVQHSIARLSNNAQMGDDRAKVLGCIDRLAKHPPQSRATQPDQRHDENPAQLRPQLFQTQCCEQDQTGQRSEPEARRDGDLVGQTVIDPCSAHDAEEDQANKHHDLSRAPAQRPDADERQPTERNERGPAKQTALGAGPGRDLAQDLERRGQDVDACARFEPGIGQQNRRGAHEHIGPGNHTGDHAQADTNPPAPAPWPTPQTQRDAQRLSRPNRCKPKMHIQTHDQRQRVPDPHPTPRRRPTQQGRQQSEAQRGQRDGQPVHANLTSVVEQERRRGEEQHGGDVPPSTVLRPSRRCPATERHGQRAGQGREHAGDEGLTTEQMGPDKEEQVIARRVGVERGDGAQGAVEEVEAAALIPPERQAIQIDYG